MFQSLRLIAVLLLVLLFSNSNRLRLMAQSKPGAQQSAGEPIGDPGDPTASVSPMAGLRAAGQLSTQARSGSASGAPKGLSLVTGIREWSTASYTRIAIDLQSEVPIEASRVSGPDRIFFDFHGAQLASSLSGKAVTVSDGDFLKRIRAAQFSNDVVRVVLDVSDVSDYSAFWLPNPSRLIVDVHGKEHIEAPLPGFARALPKSADRKSSENQELNGEASASEASAAVKNTPLSRPAGAAAPNTFIARTRRPGSRAATPAKTEGDSVAAIAGLSRKSVSRTRHHATDDCACCFSVATLSAER